MNGRKMSQDDHGHCLQIVSRTNDEQEQLKRCKRRRIREMMFECGFGW